MRVVVAPDSFKGGPSAGAVAAALAEGWRRARPHDAVVAVPLADGGEGTIDALRASVTGATVHPVTAVTGPDGEPTDAEFLLLPDGTAVVELARSSGLPLMARSDPLNATTRGLGQVLAATLDCGAPRVLVGVGGSASTDGGAGALAALGLRLTDESGAVLRDGGAALTALANIDGVRLRPPPAGGVEVLSDVSSPLLGPSGAAAVFGPQKGATAAQVDVLEQGLARWAHLLGGDPDAAGAGAAGGTAYGLAAMWGATIVSGSAAVARAAGLDEELRQADIVLSGEGAFDATSLRGKVVGGVLEKARRLGLPVCIVAGSIDAHAAQSVTATISTTDLAGSRAASLAEPERFLRQAGELLARSADTLVATWRDRTGS